MDAEDYQTDSRVLLPYPTYWNNFDSQTLRSIGRKSDTSFWDDEPETSPGWAVVGMGIMKIDSHPTIMTRENWRQLLIKPSFDVASLDGHFVGLRWRSDHLECFTDQLGLRTLYFSKYNKGICISTRLDWVAQITNHAAIDFSSLGSRWLLFNQVSYESCVTGIDRLGPGGHATFKEGQMIHSTAFNPWLPSFESGSTSTVMNLLRVLVNCSLHHEYKPSLGLSGGLNSACDHCTSCK